MKFCVFSSDPLFKYYEKGEIKPRYWNPLNIFDEVYVFSFCQEDVAAEKVRTLAGEAHLEIIPIGGPNALRLHQQYRRALGELARIKPDLVRVHNPWHAGLVGISAARKLNIPVLLSLHTHYQARRQWEKRWLLQVLRLAEYYSMRRADCVLCVSHYLTGYARSMGARRVEVIYNRVYADKFHCRRRAPEGRPIILSVGRLDPPKDQECLIRALVGLEVDLHLVGDGVNRRRLEELVVELGLGDRVQFFGSVPQAEIQTHYARAFIFALATHYEGFCIPILEAMAAGLPVVASATDPIPEILGGRGWTVEAKPAAFRKVFEELLRRPQKALIMGEKARERALELDGALMERKEAELYHSLMGVDLADDRVEIGVEAPVARVQ